MATSDREAPTSHRAVRRPYGDWLAWHSTIQRGTETEVKGAVTQDPSSFSRLRG